ncbi:MAG: cadherin-like beta sandwich domain-containing protein [Nitrospira sp. LK70]|nr:cadherin-like beta sandwich domain-containing protein [Nitrospira sp. LK70]
MMDLTLRASQERDQFTMMRTIHVVKQHLAAVFFIAIALIAFGCGDVAKVSDPVELGSLSISAGTLQPPFASAITDYAVQLSSDVSTMIITASPRVDEDAIRIDNQQTTSQTITLDSPGVERSVSIVVTRPGTGGGSKSYAVRVKRDLEDNSLQTLSVSSGTLAPAPFDKDTLDYTVNDVGTSVTSVTISATKSDPNSIMQIGSVTVPAGTASGQATVQLGGTGSATPVSIDITRLSGSKKAYRVTINRGTSGNNNLRGLTISQGTLNFRASTTSYTVNVASNVTTVVVTPRLEDATANMTVNGQAINSGQARTIPLGAPGSNTIINIIVIAQNGTQNPYSVNVIRAALGGNNNLRGLTVSQGTLNPAFNANTTNYTVDVVSGVTSITITPTLQDNNASMTVNGQAAISGQGRSIPLNGAGSNTAINIVTTAPNGNQRTYSITAERAALGGNNNLRSLTVLPGSLTPAFGANRIDYSVNLGSHVDNLTVTASVQDAGATLMINRQGAGSGQSRPIPLEPPGSTTEIDITVVAPNGNPRTYQIDAIREALGGNNNLSTLTVSPGTLAPAFSANTMEYTVNVGTVVTSIHVSATKVDSNAVMSGDLSAGTGVATGQATIPLNGAGTSTPLSVTVTAPNGSPKTYSINVNRAAPTAPPAPASAPDLTPKSDSGFNPGQDADNITNDLTPSFTVDPPAVGETPNLYIDGVKVKEGFDQGANTLTPTNQLPGGKYDIAVTSTVTNAAGLESLPSPSLDVHIDNVAPGFP